MIIERLDLTLQEMLDGTEGCANMGEVFHALAAIISNSVQRGPGDLSTRTGYLEGFGMMMASMCTQIEMQNKHEDGELSLDDVQVTLGRFENGVAYCGVCDEPNELPPGMTPDKLLEQLISAGMVGDDTGIAIVCDKCRKGASEEVKKFVDEVGLAVPMGATKSRDVH